MTKIFLIKLERLLQIEEIKNKSNSLNKFVRNITMGCVLEKKCVGLAIDVWLSSNRFVAESGNGNAMESGNAENNIKTHDSLELI